MVTTIHRNSHRREAGRRQLSACGLNFLIKSAPWPTPGNVSELCSQCHSSTLGALQCCRKWLRLAQEDTPNDIILRQEELGQSCGFGEIPAPLIITRGSHHQSEKQSCYINSWEITTEIKVWICSNPTYRMLCLTNCHQITFFANIICQTWWHTPVISAPVRQRQKDHNFQSAWSTEWVQVSQSYGSVPELCVLPFCLFKTLDY